MATSEEVRAALRNVLDPEINRPIEDIGMLKEIEIDGGVVRVHVLITIEGCPLKERIEHDVTRAVAPLSGVERVEVPLTPMSQEQRQALVSKLKGANGAAATGAAPARTFFADVRRFRSKDCFARHNGTAPLPVWSANKVRHRLSRTGNRQLNAAIHRIAITQMRIHEPARDYLERRIALGNTKPEALRALKRRLSDVVYRALLADADTAASTPVEQAA
jgi:metal-sulfur cluster biosynthetic enzyme